MKKIILLSALCLLSFQARANDINIDADERVEWYRNEQKIVAIGNAVATKNTNTLKGNVLTMIYEKVMLENGEQKNQMQKILSDGAVRLEVDGANGKGEHFNYDLPTQTAVLIGSPARLENATGEITATGSITYLGAENKSIAEGDVVAKNPDYTVYADKMISYFDTDKQGKKTLNRVEIYAKGKPVKIVNKQSTVTGRRGVYFPLENKLKIFENVVINQNNDILKGEYAETDLKTGISRLLAGKNKGSRVSGVFHNKKKKQ